MNAFAHFDRLQSAHARSFLCACPCHIQSWSIVPAESCAGACKDDNEDTEDQSNAPLLPWAATVLLGISAMVLYEWAFFQPDTQAEAAD